MSSTRNTLGKMPTAAGKTSLGKKSWSKRAVLALFALAFQLAGSGATSSVRVGPPPPPPVSPQRAQPHATAALPSRSAIVSAEGDSIVLESGVVSSTATVRTATIASALQARTFILASGESLVVNDATPVGEYPLRDGDLVRIASAPAYPRYYTYVTPRTPVMYFSIRSKRQVGVIAWESDAGGSATPDMPVLVRRYADAMRQFRYRQTPRSNGLVMFEYPADWYRRASINVPTSGSKFAVVWIAYGEPNPAPYEPPAFLGTPEIRPIRITPQTEPRHPRPPVLKIAPEEIVDGARPIGMMEIDLVTQTVTSFQSVTNAR